MNEIELILQRFKDNPEAVFNDFQESLNYWEQARKFQDKFDNVDTDTKVKMVKEAYTKKVEEQRRHITPQPIQGKDYGVFVSANPNSGDIMVQFEAYSESGQILMQKMTSGSADIGIAWLDEEPDSEPDIDWLNEDQ